MLKNFSYVVPNVLAGSAKPECDQVELLEVLQKEGIKTMISLTETPHEAAPFLQESKIQCIHFPIEDFSPPSLDQMIAMGKLATDPQNRPIMMHCRAGIGRTGTMLAVAVAAMSKEKQLDLSGLDIVSYVKQSRPKSLEVSSQYEALQQYIEYLEKQKK